MAFFLIHNIKTEPKADIINYSCMLKQNDASVCLRACVHKCSSLQVAHLKLLRMRVRVHTVHLHKCAAGVRAMIKGRSAAGE